MAEIIETEAAVTTPVRDLVLCNTAHYPDVPFDTMIAEIEKQLTEILPPGEAKLACGQPALPHLIDATATYLSNRLASLSAEERSIKLLALSSRLWPLLSAMAVTANELSKLLENRSRQNGSARRIIAPSR